MDVVKSCRGHVSLVHSLLLDVVLRTFAGTAWTVGLGRGAALLGRTGGNVQPEVVHKHTSQLLETVHEHNSGIFATTHRITKFSLSEVPMMILLYPRIQTHVTITADTDINKCTHVHIYTHTCVPLPQGVYGTSLFPCRV